MALLFTVLVTFFVLVTAEDYAGLAMAYRKCGPAVYCNDASYLLVHSKQWDVL